MYVCVCNNVSDRAIREAACRGTSSMAQLQAELKVATCCGRCEGFARRVLADALEETSWPADAALAAG